MTEPPRLLPWTLPAIDRSRRVSALFLAYSAFSALYLALGRYPLRLPVLLRPGPLDGLVPFTDWAILPYLSQYPFLLLCLWAHPDLRLRTRAYYAMGLASTAAFTAYLVLPTRVERPLDGLAGAWEPLYRLLYLVDGPGNCLPSLHVALSMVAWLSVRGSGWGFRRLAGPWCLAIWLSTLATGQHLVQDLAGGVLVGVGAWWAVPRLARLP